MKIMAFFLIILGIESQVYSQTVESQSTHEFVNGETIKFSTDGSGKSNGLKLHLKYPKSWVALDGERPHIVKKFVQPGGDAMFLINVQTAEAEFTQSEINEFFTDAGLREALPSGAKLISVNAKLKIEGLKAGSLEYTLVDTRGELTLYSHFLNYLFIYKNYFIIMQCMVSSVSGESNQVVDDKFATLRPMFSLVFNSIVIDNIWTD